MPRRNGFRMVYVKWSNAQKNCYNAIRSGLIQHDGDALRFLTLTSIRTMNRSITKCFNVLVKRIERSTPNTFVDLGYIEKESIDYYFPDKNKCENLSIDYLYVLTTEGACGVLHVLYFGDYLNEKWLKDSWEEITGGARQLIIEAIPLSDVKEVSRYIVNQKKLFVYISSQSKYVRHSYSKNWVYKSWRKDFDILRYCCYSNKYPECRLKNLWSTWKDWLVYGRFKCGTIQLFIDSLF